MKRITFYLDFISPYAYLAFEQLPRALEGVSHVVEYRPILFAGILRHHGQLGPAEIPGKREWTYRQVLWQAHAHGIPMQMPSAHPFNPLPLLRLALARGANRLVCETLFHHVWRTGADAADPARLAALQQALAPARDPGGPEVKAELQEATAAAVAAGVFGVPSFAVDGHLFWGFDALPMLRAWLHEDPWFAQAWDGAAGVPVGVSRSTGR
jgi:2-hydroxychromene-2-carboxylate isomerase